jgi:hypothetical protein
VEKKKPTPRRSCGWNRLMRGKSVEVKMIDSEKKA